jgi:hypothetical protein
MGQNDLFIVDAGTVAVGLAIWGLWDSPQHSPPKAHVAQELNIDPELKRITELSPYMRSER